MPDRTVDPPERNEPTVMSREECLQLLATLSIGRLALTRRAAPPLVVPVNYVLDGEAVVFRTDPGEKLDLAQGHAVSFQVDAIDPMHRRGWSVLVCGIAREADPSESARRLEPWAGGPKRHWLAIEPDTISGRRVELPAIPDQPADRRGYL